MAVQIEGQDDLEPEQTSANSKEIQVKDEIKYTSVVPHIVVLLNELPIRILWHSLHQLLHSSPLGLRPWKSLIDFSSTFWALLRSIQSGHGGRFLSHPPEFDI